MFNKLNDSLNEHGGDNKNVFSIASWLWTNLATERKASKVVSLDGDLAAVMTKT